MATIDVSQSCPLQSGLELGETCSTCGYTRTIEPAEYVVGLPVVVKIKADGSVHFEIDTAELSTELANAGATGHQIEAADAHHEFKRPIVSRVAVAKMEILADVENGVVPPTVATFAELHDHTDANGYGGLFDIPMRNDTERARANTIATLVQNALDIWIKADGIGKRLAERKAADR